MSANKRRKTESTQGEARAEDVEMDSEDEELKDITLEKLAVFHDTNQTWEFANERCATHGARLASIHSVAEQQFIQEISATGVKMAYSWPTYCGNGVWIGLTDVDEIGFYKWSDGTPYDYSNWGPGRPLDRGRENSYGMYYPDYFADTGLYNIFNTWDNVPNTYLARASICKQEATD